MGRSNRSKKCGVRAAHGGTADGDDEKALCLMIRNGIESKQMKSCRASTRRRRCKQKPLRRAQLPFCERLMWAERSPSSILVSVTKYGFYWLFVRKKPSKKGVKKGCNNTSEFGIRNSEIVTAVVLPSSTWLSEADSFVQAWLVC